MLKLSLHAPRIGTSTKPFDEAISLTRQVLVGRAARNLAG
jgi:hypothetical protein